MQMENWPGNDELYCYTATILNNSENAIIHCYSFIVMKLPCRNNENNENSGFHAKDQNNGCSTCIGHIIMQQNYMY